MCIIASCLKTTYCKIQLTLDISNSEGITENGRDSQSSRYQETGLKQKIFVKNKTFKSSDILYHQLYFHLTNDIP